MLEEERFTESLPCKLTREEMIDRSKELTEQLRARDLAEAAKKLSASECKDKIEKADQEIRRLGGIIRDGAEDRDVECYRVMDWSDGKVVIYRSDTNERVTSRPMTLRERQQRLPMRSYPVTERRLEVVSDFVDDEPTPETFEDKAPEALHES